MDWVTASLILFGGLSIAMGLGVPVAIAFLMLDVIGAYLLPRRRGGAVAARAQFGRRR